MIYRTRIFKFFQNNIHYVESVRIWSFFGPYSVQMRENTDQKSSKYGHFSRKDIVSKDGHVILIVMRPPRTQS